MDTLLGVQVVKAVVETALMLFVARGVLRLLFFGSAARAEQNIIYRICRAGTDPLVGLVRVITPAVVLDRHLPLAAFCLLFTAWLGLSATKISMCADLQGRAACAGIARAGIGR
jgi:hypothetical protein